MRFRFVQSTTRRRFALASLILATGIGCAGDPTTGTNTDPEDASQEDAGPASSGTDPTTNETSPTESTEYEPLVLLEWNKCDTNVECATIEVPFDYSDPSLGEFRLPVVRHLARDADRRIGSLLVNPGGPGSGGVDIAYGASDWFSDEVLDRFDIVAWDPRGTGGSIPAIDCTESMDSLFGLDPSPDDVPESDALVAAADEYAFQCAINSPGFLEYVGTEASARDIDSIRRGLGEEMISYIGFSYGTALGSVWVTLFPETVRAAVLDAAVDPELGYIDGLIDQARGFEEALYAFLDDCDTKGCGFVRDGESAREAMEAILDSLETDPIPNGDGRPDTGPGVAAIGVPNALYSSYSWSYLSDALEAIRSGDGGALLAEYDTYFGGWDDGHPDDSIDAYFGIACLDRDRSVTVEEVLGARSRLEESAPLIGQGWITEMLVCASWLVAARPLPAVVATSDVPILVVGSTGDAATPIEGTRNMARVLGRSMLLEVESDDHTSYGYNSCATRIIDDYLIDLREIPVGETC